MVSGSDSREKGIKDSWTEYMEKLMNEENEWDNRISATVKEGPADCIRMDPVAAALKKMKRHKAAATSSHSILNYTFLQNHSCH